MHVLYVCSNSESAVHDATATTLPPGEIYNFMAFLGGHTETDVIHKKE